MNPEIVEIKNLRLLTASLETLKKIRIDLGDGKDVPFPEILTNLVEVGVNLNHKIRLHFQFTEKIGLLLYLVDFTMPDEEDPGDTRENFQKRIAASLHAHKIAPESYAEKIVASEEKPTWGWYLSVLAFPVKSLHATIHPQDLQQVQKTISELIK
ncbi:MAG: hypothetical protein NTX00_05785 [Candidatus Parcubacteria bacterium]|nr:hypothetical protein [Candidatus Parcubacteria bacterium]